MRLVWTETKLTANGPSCLRKLLMILQVDDKVALTLVLRGVNSTQRLREALTLINNDELFPLSLLIANVSGGKQYYNAVSGGYVDNGVKTLQNLVKTEVGLRAKASPQVALEYTKYCVQRNEVFTIDTWLSPETTDVTIKELFDYAFNIGEPYIKRVCSCVDRSTIVQVLPHTTLYTLVQLILTDQRTKMGPKEGHYSTRLLEDLVEKLKELKEPIPEGVVDYGIQLLELEYKWDKTKSYALEELIKCYHQSRSKSIIESNAQD